MARPRLTAWTLGLWLGLGAATADAQPALYTGLITAHLGSSQGDDLASAAITPGVSMAVVDHKGLGAEIDVASTRGVDEARFADSSVTAAMLNVFYLYPHRAIRPFVSVGAGVLRVRAEIFEGQPVVSQTDFAWSAGGGVVYMLTDVVGVRGDLRYFRHFEAQGDVPRRGPGPFDYWRASAGATFAWPIR